MVRSRILRVDAPVLGLSGSSGSKTLGTGLQVRALLNSARCLDGALRCSPSAAAARAQILSARRRFHKCQVFFVFSWVLLEQLMQRRRRLRAQL